MDNELRYKLLALASEIEQHNKEGHYTVEDVISNYSKLKSVFILSKNELQNGL
jgi:hypothetical protein